MAVVETGARIRRAEIRASAINAALIDTSAVTSAKIAASNVVAAKVNTSAIIARTIAASAITRVKLQRSALQLHLRTTTAGTGVNSVGGGTGLYSVRVGFSARYAWARVTGATGSTRWGVAASINSSQVRIVLFSKVGAAGTRSTVSRVTGAAALISWCALR